ncbi:MAG: HD domain-containing protein, partial [Enterovibrio sp.]
MVAIRSTHSNDAGTFVLDEWIAQLKLDSATSDELKKAYQYCQTLGSEQELVEPLWCAREMIEILSLLNMEKETLLAALLFNVVDKNLLSRELVAEKFGNAIGKLITGVQTMAAIKFLNGNAQASSTQIDNVRHMLLAMVDDFRCVVIKLAERISFLRLIKQKPE